MDIETRVTGYTTVVFVMNMRQLMQTTSLREFDKLRGSPQYIKLLRDDWYQTIARNGTFFKPVNVRNGGDDEDSTLSAEEIGLLTGVFRQTMLNEYSAP